MSYPSSSRRRFLSTTAVATAGLLIPTRVPALIRNYGESGSLIKGVQIGVITYSFRSMPDQSAEATLGYIQEAGMSATELMGGPAESFAGAPMSQVDRGAFWRLRRKQGSEEGLTEEEQGEYNELQAAQTAYNQEMAEWRARVSMDKFEEMGKMYRDAGVTIYAFKPRAFGQNNTDAEIDYGLRAAKALGASHVTLEHPSDDAHTAKLGRMAKKHKIKVAYHGHLQQTPDFWQTALDQSKYNAMNPDLGHYVAAGNRDPLALLRNNAKRIASIHLKDRQTPANGKSNMPWGEGDTPIDSILELIQGEGYTFPATVELEYDIPEGSDAVKEVAKCLAYCRELMGD